VEPKRLLFVCTGNLCRSPMAEGLARQAITSRGLPITVGSAGTMGLVDRPAEANAVAVCAEIGVDLSRHRSRGVTAELVDSAHWVLVMEVGHAQWLREQFGDRMGDKTVMLGQFGGQFAIDDPIGGWRFQFRRSRDEIKKCVEGFLDRMPERLPRFGK
jgi:protein-tyrosine-phosphatase